MRHTLASRKGDERATVRHERSRVLPLPRGKEAMSYQVAGIDVHKSVLIVAVATAGEEVSDPAGEALEFECRRFGAGAGERARLAEWLQERKVREVVRESTA
jgi:hypothetical protein